MRRWRRGKFSIVNWRTITLWLPRIAAIIFWLTLGAFTFLVSPQSNLIIAIGLFLCLSALLFTFLSLFKSWPKALLTASVITVLLILQILSLLTVPLITTTLLLLGLTFSYLSL